MEWAVEDVHGDGLQARAYQGWGGEAYHRLRSYTLVVDVC